MKHSCKFILLSVLSSCQYSAQYEAQHYAPKCYTTGNQDCVFPATFKGKTHYKCTYDNGKAWCATSTDWYGKARSLGECDPYADCEYEPKPTYRKTTYSSSCRAASGPARGQRCVFPFKYNGRTYNECTPWLWGGQGYGKNWCSTKTDHYGNHLNGYGNYGYCERSCPVVKRVKSSWISVRNGGEEEEDEEEEKGEAPV